MRAVLLLSLVAFVGCGPHAEPMPIKHVSDASVCVSTCRAAGYLDGLWCACPSSPTLTCVCHEGIESPCPAVGCATP